MSGRVLSNPEVAGDAARCPRNRVLFRLGNAGQGARLAFGGGKIALLFFAFSPSLLASRLAKEATVIGVNLSSGHNGRR